ncbi:MAG TPA: hypothetical protein VE954_04755 [Oligoflexus sp.]|uniref:hypothetical protein n=1 Tax=Oligoflexus sp. TaxID=1971216 RepID=UPI002D37D00D|nr:hypothetical protein [Oligoflexus sp.]HYX32401.1 hypothetical protein [Oligoflexus sp.]
MKTLNLLVGLGMTVGATVQAQNNKPALVDAPVDAIYVPSGFDDNDNVEVVIHGTFPDGCHRVGTATAEVDQAKRRVTISATSVVEQDEYCVQSLTPFIQAVPLGQLEEGSYQVVYAKNPEVLESISVARRKTESPDDYLFATVENAYIDVNRETGKQSLKLQGHFPHYFIGCMVIREVRVVRDPVDVLVVQPIAELVTTDVCASQPADRSFDYTVGLQEPFQGEGLIHVRTINGTSLNRFINIP